MSVPLIIPNFPNYGSFDDNFKIYNQNITSTSALAINVPTSSAFNDPSVWSTMASTITDEPATKYQIPLDGTYNQSVSASIYLQVAGGVPGTAYNVAWALRLFDGAGTPTSPAVGDVTANFLLENDGVMLRYAITLPQGHSYVRAEPIWSVRNPALTFVNWGWGATAQSVTGRTGSNPLNFQVISWK